MVLLEEYLCWNFYIFGTQYAVNVILCTWIYGKLVCHPIPNKWNSWSFYSVLVLRGLNMSLQWCHNEPDGISYHWLLSCFLSHLFQRRSKRTSKLCVTGLCEGNPPVTSGFPLTKDQWCENCFHLMTSSWCRLSWACWYLPCLPSNFSLTFTWWIFFKKSKDFFFFFM